MQPLPIPKAPPVLYNVLPTRYKTWLNLYDRIPENLRHLPNIRMVEEVSAKEYEELTGEPASPMMMWQVDYQFQMEFILVKVAKELLPARMRKEDVNTLESAMYRASKVDGEANFLAAVELLTPLWAVAKE